MQIDSSGKEEINILNLLLEELKTDGVQTPPNMRNCDRRKLKCVTRKVEKVAQYFKVKNLGQMSNFLKAAVNVVAKQLGVKNKREFKKKAMVEKTTRRTDKRGKEGSKSIRISEKRKTGERKNTRSAEEKIRYL